MLKRIYKETDLKLCGMYLISLETDDAHISEYLGKHDGFDIDGTLYNFDELKTVWVLSE